MDSSTKQLNQSDTLYRIKDPISIFFTLLVSVILGFVSFYFNERMFAGDAFISSIFFIFVLWAALLRLKAIWNGVELNLDKGTMSFPGGGVSANNLSDYINPQYLLQSLTRFTINIEEIGQISTSLSFKHDSAAVDKYIINFVGTFGAASVGFSDKGKRDEIYNAIRQINNMGTPYVKAN